MTDEHFGLHVQNTPPPKKKPANETGPDHITRRIARSDTSRGIKVYIYFVYCPGIVACSFKYFPYI